MLEETDYKKLITTIEVVGVHGSAASAVSRDLSARTSPSWTDLKSVPGRGKNQSSIHSYKRDQGSLSIPLIRMPLGLLVMVMVFSLLVFSALWILDRTPPFPHSACKEYDKVKKPQCAGFFFPLSI